MKQKTYDTPSVVQVILATDTPIMAASIVGTITHESIDMDNVNTFNWD